MTPSTSECHNDVCIAWMKIHVEKKSKSILHGLSGKAPSGSLTAVMGHSGSGKTTLLRAIAGRCACTSGTVSFGETIASPGQQGRKFYDSIAFVADKESLEETATVHEAILFSARLRLPMKKKKNQQWVADDHETAVTALVGEIIRDLRLEKCMNTYCRDLSAGEKRRVSLAVELVSKPCVAILDEPTSGLDSFNGLMMLRCLRQLADMGCCIILSIHHPSQEMLQEIDSIYLIHQGRCMFQANVSEIYLAFENKCCPVPAGVNPADWMLTVSQMNTLEDLEKHGFFSDEEMVHEDHTSANPNTCSSGDLVNVHMSSSSNHEVDASIQYQNHATVEPSFGVVVTQINLIMIREVRRCQRDVASTGSKIAVAFVGASMFSMVMNGVARNEVKSAFDLQAHAGAAYFFLFTGIIATPALCLEFLDRRAMIDRELRTGHYSAAAIGLANFIVEFLSVLVQALIAFNICYFAVGFRGSYFILLLIYFVNAFVCLSIAIAYSSMFKDVGIAKRLIGLETFPQGLLGGFYVPVSALPEYIQWISFLIPMLYAWRLFAIEEFSFCGRAMDSDKAVFDCARALSHHTYGEDSMLTLAQTGFYTGPEAITEYLNLVSSRDEPEFSLMYNVCALDGHMDFIVHEVNNDLCDLTIASTIRGKLTPLYTSAGAEGHFMDSLLARRMKLTPNTPIGGHGYMVEEHVYWTNPVTDDTFFAHFDVEKLRSEICNTLKHICDPDYFHFGNVSECEQAMSKLVLGQWTDNGVYTFRGDSMGCRAVHNLLARAHPEMHCPHISLNATSDSDGMYKCHDSQLKRPTPSFAREEVIMFQNVARRNGILSPSLFEFVDADDEKKCLFDVVPAIYRAFYDKGAFHSFNPVCHQFLNFYEANPENVLTYWASLIGIGAVLRAISITAIAHHATTPQ